MPLGSTNYNVLLLKSYKSVNRKNIYVPIMKICLTDYGLNSLIKKNKAKPAIHFHNLTNLIKENVTK